jgi:hypothetical protein
MKDNKAGKIMLDDHLGCFGEFKGEDRICRRFCSLSLRCAIERDQNEQMELLEDLVSTENVFMKIQ